jgi:glyoxylase-like metal-dependent hydrolase (beta-lactamase superfamily II)
MNIMHNYLLYLAWMPIMALALTANARSGGLEAISSSVFLYRDTCNVYILVSEGHTLAIDFGSGGVLRALKTRGLPPPEWVLHTHHHRDMCGGDALLEWSTTKIAVPEKERNLFENADDFWQKVAIVRNYLFKPDFFTSTYNIPVNRGLEDGDEMQWRGLRIKAVATPGHTLHHMSYALSIDGRRIVFSGDVIHSPGKVLNFYSLEYRYNDLGSGGLANLRGSRDAILGETPEMLAPAHGMVMENPREALDAMLENLKQATSHLAACPAPIRRGKNLPHMSYALSMYNSHSYMISSDDGSVLLVDAGNTAALEAVESSTELERIDLIWPTHYHDDHVLGINPIRRRHNSKVYCQEILREVLENPGGFNIPCLIEEPIMPDRVLEDGETFTWGGMPFTAYHFPGQTHLHAGLLAVIDGKRVFFTGDAFDSPRHGQNYNSRNYIPLEPDGGIERCVSVLREARPDYLATGHWGVWEVNDADFDEMEQRVWELRSRLANLMPWDDPNFGMDENWVSVYPYLREIEPGKIARLQVRIRNHSAGATRLELELTLPEGLSSRECGKRITIRPKESARVVFKVKASKSIQARRHLITVNVIRDGRNLGQLCEAILQVSE